MSGRRLEPISIAKTGTKPEFAGCPNRIPVIRCWTKKGSVLLWMQLRKLKRLPRQSRRRGGQCA